MRKRAIKSIFNEDPEIQALLAEHMAADELPTIDELRLLLRGERGEKGDRGEPGKDGKTPEKFKDYFTDEEVAWMMEQISRIVLKSITDNLKAELTPKKGVDYRDGKDATDVDIDALLKVLLLKLPKPETVDQEALQKKIYTLLISKIPTAEDFVEEIRKKKLLSVKDINGYRLDNPDKKASGGFNMNDQRWHGAGGSTSTGASVTTQYLLTATQDGDDVEIDLTQLTNYATLDQILVVYRNNIPQTETINFTYSDPTLTILQADAGEVFSLTYSYTS